MNKDEAEIRELLDKLTRAIRDKDAARAIELLAPDAVAFDLDPPLWHGPEITHDRARLEQWFATWQSPIESQPGDLTIITGVAYAYGLQHMTGTKSNGEKSDLWFRATACFRRDDGHWRITHIHNSVPFAMDGSYRALVDLKPDA